MGDYWHKDLFKIPAEKYGTKFNFRLEIDGVTERHNGQNCVRLLIEEINPKRIDDYGYGYSDQMYFLNLEDIKIEELVNTWNAIQAQMKL